MPDKRIDEQFVNHAWEQMLATLDQEMPVEQKRRRVVLVPWRLAAAASVLLLLTVGAGWWLSHLNPQSTPTIADSTSTVSSQKEQSAPQAEDAIIAAMETTKPEVLVQKETQDQPLQHQHANVSVKPHQAFTTPAISKQNTHNTPANRVASSKVQTIQHLAGAGMDNNAPAIQELGETPENKATSIAQTETTAPPTFQNQSLASLKAQEIAMLEKELVKIEGKKPVQLWTPAEDKNESDSKWNIGLELATYSSAGAALDGYAGGAVVEVPVQSEKFNLRTGLNFNSQQRYFDSNVPVEEAGRGNNPGFSGTSVVVDPNPDLKVNAQQLSFPLTLEFKPRKSWGVEGGLQASYLLGARNLKGAEAYQTMTGLAYGNQEVKTLLDGLTSKASPTNNSGSTDNTPLNIDAFRRFDMAVTAGFGYYPTTNIGVRLQYQRGLIDMLKADQFKTFGNNVRLSAVYFFGK